MNAAVQLLEQKAAEVPSVTVVPNPLQPPPSPDRPYVVSLKLDFNNSGAVDVAKQLRSKVGIYGDQPGRLENGKVDFYVIGQGALGAAAQSNTKHDIAEAERWNLPIVLIVLLAVFGSLAAASIPLVLGICHRRDQHGSDLSAVDGHDDVGVRHPDGVDVRNRAGR